MGLSCGWVFILYLQQVPLGSNDASHVPKLETAIISHSTQKDPGNAASAMCCEKGRDYPYLAVMLRLVFRGLPKTGNRACIGPMSHDTPPTSGSRGQKLEWPWPISPLYLSWQLLRRVRNEVPVLEKSRFQQRPGSGRG